MIIIEVNWLTDIGAILAIPSKRVNLLQTQLAAFLYASLQHSDPTKQILAKADGIKLLNNLVHFSITIDNDSSFKGIQINDDIYIQVCSYLEERSLVYINHFGLISLNKNGRSSTLLVGARMVAGLGVKFYCDCLNKIEPDWCDYAVSFHSCVATSKADDSYYYCEDVANYGQLSRLVDKLSDDSASTSSGVSSSTSSARSGSSSVTPSPETSPAAKPKLD